MKKIILIFISIIFIVGCSDSNGAKRILKEQGYKNIKTTGWAPLSCSSKDDFFSTSFIAKNQNNIEVRGAVCHGLFFKASTIRFY